MSGSNGHSMNGDGGLGAAAPIPPPVPGVPTSVSSEMRLMQRVVNTGHKIMDEQIDKMITLAVSIRDNDKASDRDRMRASELLAAMLKHGIDVAMYVDKLNRIDGGKPTDVITIRYADENSVRMGALHR